MESQVLELEAQAVHWLRDKPSTIIIDRLQFILNRAKFQTKIDEAARVGRKLEIPSKKLFLIKHEDVWHRTAIKFFDEKTNKCVLLCVDTSKTVDFSRNRFEMRSIHDPEVSNEPWCRMKCYIYGVDVVDPPISSDMVELFDSFFTNCQFTALVLPIPQTNPELLRYTYRCDFIKQTENGYQSFRNLILATQFAKAVYSDKAVNNRLNYAVNKLLVRLNREDTESTLCPLTSTLSSKTIKFQSKFEEINELEMVKDTTAADTESILKFRSEFDKINELEMVKGTTAENSESTLYPATTWMKVKTSTLVKTETADQASELKMVTVADIFQSPEVPKYIIFPKEDNKLGKGSYGTVLKGEYIESKKMIAVKKIKVPLKKITLKLESIASEVNILKSCDHNNVVKLLGVYLDSMSVASSIYVFLSFDMASKDLSSYIHENVQYSMTRGQIMGAMQMILRGLAYIHNEKIVHRDVKPSNILVFHDGVVRLCDFGLAISKKSPLWKYRYTGCGTKIYMSPEMLLETYDYDCAVDIWSVGCTLIEMATGVLLFGLMKRTWEAQLNYIFLILGTPECREWPEFFKIYPKYPKHVGSGIENILFDHPELVQLAKMLLALNPSKRCTAQDALDNEFFWNTKEESLI